MYEPNKPARRRSGLAGLVHQLSLDGSLVGLPVAALLFEFDDAFFNCPMHYAECRNILFAAKDPGAQVIPPPGCDPLPQRNKPGMGVSYVAQEGIGRVII